MLNEKEQFKEYMLKSLNYFCDFYEFQGTRNDILMFHWFTDMPSIPNSTPFGVGISELMESKNKIILGLMKEKIK